MKKKRLLTIFALAIFALLGAQPGTNDAAFNPVDIGYGNGDGASSTVNTSALQADGKLIIGGSLMTYNGTIATRIARINTDGTLDATFVSGTGFNNTVNIVRLQPDGKIVVGGAFTDYNGIPVSRITRLNSDGTVDATFNPGTGASSTVSAMAVQPDGKILIGGSFTLYNGVSRSRIARLNTDGSVDATFVVGTGANSTISAIAIQSDGKIIIGGSFTTYNAVTANRIARLTVTGTLDPTFTSGTGPSSTVSAIAIQADGKMIIGGSFSTYNGTTASRIARINSNGTFDATFSIGSGTSSTVNVITLQADGKVLIGGAFTTYNLSTASRIARINTNGTLDPTFATGTGANSTVSNILLRTDGSVYIGGSLSSYNNFTVGRIARLQSNGTFDNTFNPSTGANAAITASVVQADGKIVIAGTFTAYNNVTRTRIVRLNTDGTLDVAYNTSVGANSTISAMAIQADGKVIIGGSFTTFNGSSATRIARINTDGTFDATFSIGTGPSSTVNAIAIQTDGKVLIGGAFTTYNGTSRSRIARLNVNGTLDATFLPGTGASSTVSTICIQTDGRIIIGGSFTSYGGTSINRLARLNSAGGLDPSFAIGTGPNSTVNATVIQTDGKIIVGGAFTSYNGSSRPYVLRVNTDGTLDATFNTGIGASSTVNCIVLQADGKPIIGGLFITYDNTGRNRIARLNTDGTLNTTFDPGTGANNTVSTLSLQADGKVIAAGSFTAYRGVGRNRIVRIEGGDGTQTGATFYRDADNDTYGDADNSVHASSAPAGYVTDNTDCNDSRADIHPNASETCNGLDDNCDVLIDEDDPLITGQPTWYADADNDGFGNNAVSVVSCDQPTDFVSNNTDCNDANPDIHPGAELCNGLDDNCDGLVDNADPAITGQPTWYADTDLDGFGDLGNFVLSCIQPVGYITNNTDCDDNNINIHASVQYFIDADHDGYGSTNTAMVCSLTPTPGYSTNNTDCNDNNATIHPGATESCNGHDDNCNGLSDNADPAVTGQQIWYEDADNDSYGKTSVTQLSCTQPSGYVLLNNDCNDADNQIHPGKPETCDGTDNNCNNQTDEGVLITFYADNDHDGFGDIASPVLACFQPADHVINNTDCDDNNINIHARVSYFIDADLDDFGSNTTALVCSLTPPNGYSTNNTDCNDNNSSGHTPSGFVFSGSANFATSVVYPTVGEQASTYSFEITYTDADGNLPQPGYPRLILDYEGNVNFNGGNDQTIIMFPVDVNDLDVTNGKKYSAQVLELPVGSNWTANFLAIDEGGCQTLQSFAGPDVIEAPNVAVFANDIVFSSNNPNPGSTITVTTTIHNTSSQPVTSFAVQLINHYDLQITYPEIAIQDIPANGTKVISWQIQTPSIPAWVPMQVVIDYTDDIIESNELDNQAIRPYVNGNFAVPGSIAVTASASPASFETGSSEAMYICGTANYSGTAVPLQDPSVAGATVNVQILQTGETFTGFTDSRGNYCISFPRPGTVMGYTVIVSITDFTVSGQSNASFTVLPSSDGPDLTTCVSLSASEIFMGESVSGTVTVTNIGGVTAGASILNVTVNNGQPSPGQFNTPSLAPGQSETISFGPITFPNPGSYQVLARADLTHLVVEKNENNNTNRAVGCSGGVYVCHVLTDLTASYPPPCLGCTAPTTIFRCNSITFAANNPSCIPVNTPFIVKTEIFQNSILINSQQQTVTTGVARKTNHDGSVYATFSNLFPVAGVYEVVFSVDAGGSIDESDKANNSFSATFTVNDCKPDLRLSSCNFEISPVDPVYPGNISVTTQLSNSGNATALAPFVVDFELNGNHYPVTVNSNIDGGSSVQITGTLPTPAPGCNILSASVDYINTIIEQDESNNHYQFPLDWDFRFVIPPSGGFWSGYASLGKPNTFSIAIGNDANYTASQLQTKFEVSGPGISGWLNLGTVTNVNVGHSCTGGGVATATLPVPFVFTTPGTYLVRMTTDINNAYTECNENNNSLTVSVTAINIPDYRILSQHIAPSTIKPNINEPVTLSISYENLGASNTTDSLNLLVMVDEILLQKKRVKGLVNGALNTVQLTPTWSSPLAGLHVIRAITDSDNQIAESDESNNAATRSINVCDNSIQVALPDFSFIQNGALLSFQDLSTDADSYLWDFGDNTSSTQVNPVKTYSSPGVYELKLSVGNPCGTIFKKDTVVVPGIAHIKGTKGSDSAVVSVIISGVGFVPGSTVKLVNSAFADISGQNVEIVDSRTILCRFNLFAQPVGFRDVAVRLSDATTYILKNGYEIVTAQPYRFNVSITGRKRGRRNEYIPTPINIVNNGLGDGAGLIYIAMQSELVGRDYRNLSLIGRRQSLIMDSAHNYLVQHGLDTSILKYEFFDAYHNNAPFAAFILPDLPASSQYITNLFQISSFDGRSQQAARVIPLLNSEALNGNLSAGDGDCFMSEFVRNAVAKTFSINIDKTAWTACFTPRYNNFISEVLQKANSNQRHALLSMPSCLIYMMTSMASGGCITGLPSTLTNEQLKSVVAKTVSNLMLFDDTESVELDCHN